MSLSETVTKPLELSRGSIGAEALRQGLRTVALAAAIACVVCQVVAPLCGGRAAEAQLDSREKVRSKVVIQTHRAAAGGDLVVAVVMDHDEGWHIHTNDPQVPSALDVFTPIKTEIDVALPDDSPLIAHMSLIQWPAVHIVDVAFMGPVVQYGVFSGRAIAYLPMSVKPDAPLGQTTLTVKLRFQACNDTSCLRQTPWLSFPVTLDITAGDQLTHDESNVGDDDVFDGFLTSVWERIHGGSAYQQPVHFNVFGWKFQIDATGPLGIAALIALAALGGVLLNFTPCVLPIIPIKILSLSQSASGRGRCLGLGMAMSVGVMAFWMGLGGAIACISGFTAINELFKHPPFIIIAGLVIALMAVGMCGLFSFRLPNWVYRISPQQDSYVGSFGLGVMTAVLSTPCTAPFMGYSAAWAVQQVPALTLATFAAIGLGMALPYSILSGFPQLVGKLPRTGQGSELLKQVMGLLMLAAAAFFVGLGLSGLLAVPDEKPSDFYWWLVFAFVAAAGLWMAYRTMCITASVAKRATFVSVGTAFVCGSLLIVLALTDCGPIAWQYYTPKRFATALRQGKVVVMDFTAEWCLNCKALELYQLHDQRVVEALDQDQVVPMKVDITGPNVDGRAKLAEVGHVTIPLLVVFDHRGVICFKSDAYTSYQVIEAIKAVLRQRDVEPE